MKENGAFSPSQDRRSLLLLIALIDLTRAANAASGEMRSRVPCLSFIDAAGAGAGVRRPRN